VIGVRVAAAVGVLAASALAAVLPAQAQASASGAKAQSRAAREARFLRNVDPHRTANLVTGDLSYYTGSHVDYVCDVDTIVRSGVILGQCGSEAEPIDLFVRLPTAHLRVGARLRVLGIMEPPATWADVMGHTVYYAFVRAVFVDAIVK
jgi:hypothetical protein